MLRLFKTRAQRYPFSFEAGTDGVAADISTTARKDDGLWVTKIPLMQGCLDAYEHGRTENLAAFLDNYLLCALEKRHSNTLAADDSFRDLIYKPLVRLLSLKNYSPVVLKPLSEQISPSSWSLITDVCVSRAALRNELKAAQAFIALGGKADEWRGQPLRHAACAGHVEMTRLLLQHGADIAIASPPKETQRYAVFMETVKAAKPPAQTFTKTRVATAAIGVGALAAAVALVARKSEKEDTQPVSGLGVVQQPRTQIKKPVITSKKP